MLSRSNRYHIAVFLLAALVLFAGLHSAETSEAAQLDDTTAVLTEVEKADLAYMREEEKLARDLYLAFHDLYGTPAFGNIATAEQRHMASVLILLERYGLEDPVVDNGRGIFSDPDLAALYEQLLAEGSESLTEALRVAAAVEEIDILDLQESLANTDEVDIKRVYGNLLAGSTNHLRAYSALWEGQTGQSYVPQFMDVDAYEALAGGQSGRPGRGNGRSSARARNGARGERGR